MARACAIAKARSVIDKRNLRDMTPLHIAASNGNVRLIAVLLDYGCGAASSTVRMCRVLDEVGPSGA